MKEGAEAYDGGVSAAAADCRAQPEEEHMAEPDAEQQLLGEEHQQEDDMPSIISALAELNSSAMGFLRRGQVVKALKQMDRATKVCEAHEQSHPAIAVETSRVKLNLGAALSANGQNLEALSAIKDAQRGLASVMAWVDDCDGEDSGVAAIAAEAGALQCAALMAEGIELEGGGMELAKPAARAAELHTQLYEEATSLGEQRLPQRHPVVALARRLRAECAVCAPGQLGEADSPSKAGSRLVLPRVKDASAGGREGRKRSKAESAPGANPAVPPAVWQEYGEESPSRSDSARSPGDSSASPQRQRALARSRSNMPPKKAEGKKDIFAEFVKDAEAEKFAKMQGSETWQEDARKRLGHLHKTTRLMLEQSPDDELKEKRYSYNGHKVMMQSYLKDNRSRSDPSLMKESRRAGLAPEIFQVRKYNKELFVKPPTPPPAAPPPKPVIDEGLAGLFARPKAIANPMDF